MKKIFITSLIAGFLISIFLLLSTCKQTTEPEEKDETGLVVPGLGMDGVKLGDTLETVLKKLADQVVTDLRMVLIEVGLHICMMMDRMPD